ncbi:MAG: 4-hydroxy-tetrahydrodipicolinate synthase [Defluviitaleaceae bacterium]|nr:4-hydroxy-tetrahydrodipicolinate synthase [Defluviitaleaceae bacterium]
MSIFTGSGVAVCTPFDSAGKINYTAYEKLIDFQVKEGTDAIVACGTTGEATTLSNDEHIEVVLQAVSFTKKANTKYNKNVPVIAGAGGNDTAKCIEMSRALYQAGANALMCVTPYYNKTSQKGLVQHYSAIAAAVDLPIVVYNVPSRTALNMLPATLYEISKLPNIVAMKEASGDIVQVAEMIELCGDAITMYSGNDNHIVPMLSLGGKGVISTTGNVAPATVHNIVMTYLNGNHEASLRLQLSILPLVRCLFADVNPMPIKAALNMMGFDVGNCRLPLTSIDESLHDKLKQEMNKYGLLDM